MRKVLLNSALLASLITSYSTKASFQIEDSNQSFNKTCSLNEYTVEANLEKAFSQFIALKENAVVDASEKARKIVSLHPEVKDLLMNEIKLINNDIKEALENYMRANQDSLNAGKMVSAIANGRSDQDSLYWSNREFQKKNQATVYQNSITSYNNNLSLYTSLLKLLD